MQHLVIGAAIIKILTILVQINPLRCRSRVLRKPKHLACCWTGFVVAAKSKTHRHDCDCSLLWHPESAVNAHL